MEPVFFFKNMLDSEAQKLQEYFLMKKLKKFYKVLMAHFSTDGVLLEIKAQKFKKHSAYEVEMVLKLPHRTLTSTEASHMITKAVDLAKDRLDIQIRKEIEQMRRDHRGIKAHNKVGEPLKNYVA